MKTFITILTLAALATTSAVAKTATAKRADSGSIYQSHAQGNQSYPNPDRVFPAESYGN
jgi:hypothetical protein